MSNARLKVSFVSVVSNNVQNAENQRSMTQIGGLCFGGNQVHLFHLFLLPHFAPKCRWGIKEKPPIMIDYQRFSLFYHLCK